MSGAKRVIEEQAERWREATEIAVAGGALRACDHHDDILLITGQSNELSYKIANTRFSSRRLVGTYGSRRDLTDHVKAAAEEGYSNGCPRCEKLLE